MPLHRLTAFTDVPTGGNPAGVWIGDEFPSAGEMQRIAAEVGYSETAFLAPSRGLERTVRYYSPAKEIDFCGHATIASGVLLGETEGEGSYRFLTRPGLVPVEVRTRYGRMEAALTSVEPRHVVDPPEVGAVLDLLGWALSDLDDTIPPARAFAGAWHLVLAARGRERLATLEYPFEPMRALMLEHDLTTLQLVWRKREGLWHSRNPFAAGGVVEDPATGAAAAALGGYLRDAGLLQAPDTFTIRQGEAMGRPSVLEVEVPEAGGIVVAGGAVGMG